MRVLVFLLILSNMLFFAWTQGYLGNSTNPDALRLQQQLLADQVRVVARDEPPPDSAAKPARVEKAEKVEKVEKLSNDVCLLLADLPVADLSRLETSLPEKFAAFKAERTQMTGSGYWVFIPPLPNKPEAERKASELKKLKVPEFFVVQEPAAMRFAISLGIFSTREAAEERLEALRSKGVRSAKVGERDAKPTHGALEIRGPEEQVEALRQAIAEWLPKNKPAPCKAGKPAAQ